MSIIGAGKNLTTLKRASSAYGTVIRCDTSDNVLMSDFAIDGGLSGFPTNANNGIRVFDCNNVTCRNISVTNFANCAILVFVTTAGTKKNVIIDNCDCDGASTANDGFLLVSMDSSVIRHCTARNIRGGTGPNYGLQLKNFCTNSAIEDSYALNCVVGFAYGNDDNIQGASGCRVTGGIARNCDGGFLGGYFDHCEIDGLVIAQQTGNLEAIRIQGDSANNAFTGIVITGTPSPKGAVRFDDTTNLNFVEVNLLDAACGSVGEFEGTSSNNQVVLRRYGTNKPTNEKSGASTGTGNEVWVHSRPQDQIRLTFGENMQAENFDRILGRDATAMVTQTAYFMRVPLKAGQVISNIDMIVTAAGSGLTLSKVGIYKKDGTQLASSADQGTAWQSVGLKVNALSSSFTVPSDDVYFFCLIAIGTTPPTVLSSGAVGNKNAASSGGVIPYGTMLTQTDLPSPATISTSSGVPFWVGAP